MAGHPTSVTYGLCELSKLLKCVSRSCDIHGLILWQSSDWGLAHPACVVW